MQEPADRGRGSGTNCRREFRHEKRAQMELLGVTAKCPLRQVNLAKMELPLVWVYNSLQIKVVEHTSRCFPLFKGND